MKRLQLQFLRGDRGEQQNGTELRLDGDRKSGEEDRRQPIPFDLARDRK